MWVDSKTAAAVLGVSNRAIQKACANSKFSDKKICTIKSKILNFRYQDNSRGGSSGKVLQIWLDKIPAKENSNEFLAGIWECDPNEAKENSNEAEIWSNKTLATKDTKGESNENIKHTRTSRAFAKQGLQGGSLCRAWQGEYKSSKDWQDDTTKETSPQPKSHKGSINDEKYNWDEQRRASGDFCSHERDEYSRAWGDSKSTNIAKCDKTSYETQEERLDKSSQNRTIADRESVIGADIRENRANKANFVIDKWGKSDVKNSVSGNFCNIHNMGGFAVDIDNSGVCVGVTSDNRREISKDINDKENKANLEEIRNSHISSSKHNNADDSVDEFQSYAVTKEQKVELAELFDDMSINDDKKADAFLKAKVVKLWLKARDRKVKIDAFLSYININKMYDKRVSKGQIYDWARRYANGGIKGLVDERGGNRPLLVELLGYKEKVDELILASQGKISSYNVYNRLHHHFVSLGLLSHDEFIGKQKEIVAYDSINRYVNKWKKENPTTVLYIEKGYDGAVNSKLAELAKLTGGQTLQMSM
ncbi:helix-turn-helix domain-containing protein [Campylobacter fetus]|uniref:helix-turn-helix domain-containing protein n=1 Tax=Campylobacter fetus TaxID=196 RepID=UPI0026E09BAA|nr:helix-turn-helix domain-containing protein [Campylobacter fetus]WKW21671.1 helix-turn-helix domain-containing protein [Campylobacter fetus subsp. venerealis]